MKYINYAIILLWVLSAISCNTKSRSDQKVGSENYDTISRVQVKDEEFKIGIDSIPKINCSENKYLWQEGRLLGSKHGIIYQFRAYIHNKNLFFYYLTHDSEPTMKIIEKSSWGEEFIVDTIDIHTPNEEQNDIDDFVQVQFDNLMEREGFLYYYKQKSITKEYLRDQKKNRLYYKYKIGSQEEPEEITSLAEIAIMNRISFNSVERVAYSNDSVKSAYTNGFELQVSDVNSPSIDNVKVMQMENFQPKNPQYANGFSMNQALFADNSNIIDPYYGEIAWGGQSKKLFFTINTLLLKGLWMCDMQTKELSQIYNQEVNNLFAFTFHGVDYVTFSKGYTVYCIYQNDDLKVDSIMNTESVHASYPENVGVIPEDEYWNRRSIYESTDSREMLFNPKCAIVNDTLRYFFYGQTPDTDESIMVTLYQLIPEDNNRVIVIDKFRCKGEVDDFYRFMKDALILTDDMLYYLKKPNEAQFRYEVYDFDLYRSYSIGSNKHNSESKIFKEIKNVNGNIHDCYFTRDTRTCAWHIYDGGYIYIMKINNSKSKSEILDSFKDIDHHYRWMSAFAKPYSDQDEQKYLRNKTNIFNSLKELGVEYCFTVKSTLVAPNLSAFAIGRITWNAQGDEFYFCNSNRELACIWQVNIDTEEVEKIVPEHDAIHPHYFLQNHKPAILYVYRNKLMVATSPEWRDNQDQ
ncbi:hypothetical protein OAT16_06790 [Prolixibacteraceae bacterium]|nr:hypothetical protein [Prolixibacteraceae bacterium]